MNVNAVRHAGYAFAALTGAGFFSPSASAQSPAEFYRGKTVILLVGYAPGGGYDIYTRLLSRHVGRHIPGQPSVVVQNMPGAAGVVAANNVFVVAPKDGTVIAAVDQNIPMFQLLGGKGVRYDVNKFSWLGSMASSNGIAMAWHSSGVRALEDAKAREVSMGTTGANDDAYVYAKTLNALLGTKFKAIQGYSGTTSVNLAMESGEVEAMGRATYYGFLSQRPDWLRDKKVNILVQLGATKQPELPDVPLFTDLLPEGRPRQIAQLVSMPTGIGYSHWLAPEVPSDRIDALRRAYGAVLQDPDLLAEAKQLGVEIRPKRSADIQALVKTAADTPADVRAETARILGWE